MKIDTISTIAIAIGSFLLGSSLGLALNSGCDICRVNDDDEEIDFEEESVTEQIVTKESSDDIYTEYKQKASEYYVQESLDTEKPRIISRESYENEYLNFHKESLVYFMKDNVLVDDRDEVIDNVEQILGSSALDSFGEGSEDDDIVYVRNTSMQCDFEVVRENMSYRENVLGISEDYIKARKFFNLEE